MGLEFISEWFRFADSDLSSAEHLLSKHPAPLELICYLCEQSAEKHLKGYLIFKGIMEPPKTHNIILLCKMCSEYDERFQDIRKACETLNRYGVQPRYPNELEIHEHHMQKALEYARQIRDSEPLKQVRRETSQCNTTGS